MGIAPSVELETEVVIVGAGPSGLGLAIELGSRGVRTLLIERNERVGLAPRAKTTNVRTRTHLRRWGIADKLAEASPFGVDYPSDVHFVTKLCGQSLAVIRNASNCSPIRVDDYPEHGQWIPQYKLEEVLREHAESLPSTEIRFGMEFISVEESKDRVTALARNLSTDDEIALSAKFLVGADGARSLVRDLIGARMNGTYGLSRNYNIVFRAPGLADAHRHGPGTMYWQIHPSAPSLIGPMDRNDVWFFMPTRVPDGFGLTQETASALIREATGIDLPYEILSSDEWIASSLIADRYRRGRSFLIGDACHLHPPFGGYGMNMGIADAVDLGWKLAASCQGWGGARLLDSYQLERKPVHEAVIAEAQTNHAALPNDFWTLDLERDGADGDEARSEAARRILGLKTREFQTLGTVLGDCYHESPIIALESASAAASTAPADSTAYTPSSRPGCLAPHFWRQDGSSLYDSLGRGFSLLCRLGASQQDIAAAQEEARLHGVPLEIVRIGKGEGARFYPRLMTLVRPDQFIAWRGDNWKRNAIELAAGWKGMSASHSPKEHDVSERTSVAHGTAEAGTRGYS